MINSIYSFWQTWLGSLTAYTGSVWTDLYDKALHVLSWCTVGFALALAIWTVFSLVHIILSYIRF